MRILLAAFLLFSAYIDKVNLILGNQIEAGREGVTLLSAVNMADVGVFVTRFTWFGRMEGAPGASHEMFEAWVLVRAVVLVWALVSWVRREPEPTEIERRAVETPSKAEVVAA